MKTYIPGKDAALESTIETMQAKLAARGFMLNESSLLHEVDGIWSLRLTDNDCPLLCSHGKGATELAARASAYGAFFERLSTHYFWTHFYLGEKRARRSFVHYSRERWFAPSPDGAWPAGLLDPELHAFYNPDGDIDAEVLVDLNSGNVERGISALPYERLRDGATTWFPVKLIGDLYASNGMAAGNTWMEARSQALAEIVERRIKNRIIDEGLCLPDVPDEVVARYPNIQAGIAGLRKAGFGVLVKDASLGGKYPVMNVTLIDSKHQRVFSSYGAHPRFAIALERAMTGLLQGRLPEPSWTFLSDKPDYPFVDWNFSSTTETDYRWLVDCLHREGKNIYIADFSEQGAYTCRILVPGFSEVGRVENLNSIGNAIRPQLLRLQALSESECADLLELLRTLNVNDERPLWEMLGLAVSAETPWKQLRVGELKTLLALAIGDHHGVLEGCEWIGHVNDLPAPRKLVYRCIESMLQVDDIDAVRRPMHLLYGEATVRQAEALLQREERFFGLDKLGPNVEGSALHQSLLAAYDKLFA